MEGLCFECVVLLSGSEMCDSVLTFTRARPRAEPIPGYRSSRIDVGIWLFGLVQPPKYLYISFRCLVDHSRIRCRVQVSFWDFTVR